MSTGTPPGVRYHYVITLRWGDEDAVVTTFSEGVVAVAPGTRRHEVFQRTLDYAIAESGEQGSPAVLFFSLEPDELPVPALNGADR